MVRNLWPNLKRSSSPVEVLNEQVDSFALAYPNSVWQAYVIPLDLGYAFGVRCSEFGLNERLFTIVGDSYPCRFYWGMVYHRPRLESELVSEIARVLSHITTVELLGMEIVANNDKVSWVVANGLVSFEQAAMLVKSTAEITHLTVDLRLCNKVIGLWDWNKRKFSKVSS